MLDTLMTIGSYRVSYFNDSMNVNPLAFGFYIRGEKGAEDAYSRDAKNQLYAGLMLIQDRLQMHNLRGIYVDVDAVENLQRPAYMQLKSDLISGYFRRVFVLDESALLGTPSAERDLRKVYDLCGGFELLVCRDGDCATIELPWNK